MEQSLLINPEKSEESKWNTGVKSYDREHPLLFSEAYNQFHTYFSGDDFENAEAILNHIEHLLKEGKGLKTADYADI